MCLEDYRMPEYDKYSDEVLVAFLNKRDEAAYYISRPISRLRFSRVMLR